VGTLLLPALLREPLSGVAAEAAAQQGTPRRAPLIQTHLQALAGRVMQTGGWVSGARSADAEPLWTGRSRPYDESTLRKATRRLARQGGVDVVARAVEVNVEEAVKRSGAKAVAYTDMFDQVNWTKKPAHAAPIGNRGNRILGATYFGMTFVRPKNGPALGYHVSWHKPASPLQDGLEALYDTPRRGTWLRENIRQHVWDRGGCGRPTLRWALERRIPYLTVDKKRAQWRRFQRPPRLYTRQGVPVFVRPDRTVSTGAPKDARPEEVIFPAHPRKGRASGKALRYRTGTPLANAELRELDRVYKTRWPSNENPIKALVAVGFDRNLDRGITLMTSRGTDGRLARVEARQQELDKGIEALKPTTIPELIRRARPLARRRSAIEEEREKIAVIPIDKGARMPTGAELLCKNLTLLIYNVLALLLMRSPLEQVRAMTPWRVQELLLSRPFVASVGKHETTLWIDPLPTPSERTLQQELVRLMNQQPLSLRGRALHLRIRDPSAKTGPLRI